MSEDHDHEEAARKRVQRRETAADQHRPSAEHAAGPETPATYPGRLIVDSRLSGRGNGPVRGAVYSACSKRTATGLSSAPCAAVPSRPPRSRSSATAPRPAVPPVPDFQLTPPRCCKRPIPPHAIISAGDQHLHLDPEVQALAAAVYPAAARPRQPAHRIDERAAGGAPHAGGNEFRHRRAPGAATAPAPRPRHAPGARRGRSRAGPCRWRGRHHGGRAGRPRHRPGHRDLRTDALHR